MQTANGKAAVAGAFFLGYGNGHSREDRTRGLRVTYNAAAHRHASVTVISRLMRDLAVPVSTTVLLKELALLGVRLLWLRGSRLDKQDTAVNSSTAPRPSSPWQRTAERHPRPPRQAPG